jgi:hypothetical protein
MSWQTVNQVLGLAMINTQFADRLLTDPLPTVQELGFDLTEKEQRVLQEVKARDIVELSQILIEKLNNKSY